MERALDQEGDASHFKPTKSRPNALKGCAALGKLPTLSFNVRVSDAERRATAMAEACKNCEQQEA